MFAVRRGSSPIDRKDFLWMPRSWAFFFSLAHEKSFQILGMTQFFAQFCMNHQFSCRAWPWAGLEFKFGEESIVQNGTVTDLTEI